MSKPFSFGAIDVRLEALGLELRQRSRSLDLNDDGRLFVGGLGPDDIVEQDALVGENGAGETAADLDVVADGQDGVIDGGDVDANSGGVGDHDGSGIDVLARDHARCDDVDRTRLCARDGALAIERTPERVDDATDELGTDRGLDDAAGRLDLAALLDAGVLAEDDRADGVLFQVEGEAEDVVAEVQELGGHAVREAVDARDAVADLDDGAHVHGFGLSLEPLDLRFDDVGDL